LAITPIRQQAPIGAIGTYWKEQTVPTAEQMEQLQALANSASVALENVGLYSALEQRIEELKEANRAKDEFLMTVSHELRTPLNSILGWSDILKDMTWQDADLNEGLNSISRNAHGQAQIIEDLLDSSRIVLGRFSLQKDELEFMDIVNEAVEQSFEKADKKNIQIDFRNALSSARVDGEGRRLRQIIKNILDNAIKFSPEGSTVYVDVEKMGPNLCVTVRDQGVGMSEELVTSLYDRFKQVDASTTRKFGGLGLGLSLAHYLAEAHGGRITAESEGEGHGSTFRFILPEKLALFSDQNLTL
ncbi:MAG: HAMP domain-containing sensor histidine kinase, partial [Bdellovibrio sp.]